MIPEAVDTATASTEEVQPAPAVTYLVTRGDDGDLETGAVLLDRQPIGRLRHRRRPNPTHPFQSHLGADSVWHAEAVGWLPDANRPWDTRITSTAPTRRRAVEDLLRSYRNHR